MATFGYERGHSLCPVVSMQSSGQPLVLRNAALYLQWTEALFLINIISLEFRAYSPVWVSAMAGWVPCIT